MAQWVAVVSRVLRNELPWFCYGHSIWLGNVTQLPESMLCKDVVNYHPALINLLMHRFPTSNVDLAYCRVVGKANYCRFLYEQFRICMRFRRSIPGKIQHYVTRYVVDNMALRIVCIDSVNPCGLRSNIDLTHYRWYIIIIILPIMQYSFYHRIPRVIKLYTHVNTNLK